MNTTKIIDNGESNGLPNAICDGWIDVYCNVAGGKERGKIEEVGIYTYCKAGGFLTNDSKQSEYGID
jgi:hypothetical protein